MTAAHRLGADTDAHPYGMHALPEVHGSPSDVYRLIARITHHSYPVPVGDYAGRHRATTQELR